MKKFFVKNYKKIGVLGLTVVFMMSLMNGLFLSVPQVLAASISKDTGNATSVFFTGADDSWSHPDYAQGSNNQHATATLGSSGDVTYYLKATNFGFNIPIGSTIDGIQIQIERKQACNQQSCSSNVTDNVVKIVKNGLVTGNDYASATHWPTSNTVETYGSGTTDKWGAGPWIASDINNTNFGVVLSAQRSSGGDRIVKVDNISITVYYTPACTPTTWYQDSDSDTYGNLSITTQACSAPAGYVADNTDCDDTNSSVNPGATEICDNQLDDDCDGDVDEADTDCYVCGNGIYEPDNGEQCDNGGANVDNAEPIWAQDEADAYRQYCSTECQIYPVPGMYCGDNIINDSSEQCDGDDLNQLTCETLNGFTGGSLSCANTCTFDTSGCTTQTEPTCTDADLDGYAIEGDQCGPVDCDDADLSINPGATEICGNEVDENCDGTIATCPSECIADLELIINGGFETPIVTNQAKWDIFPSGTINLGWLVNWFNELNIFNDISRPEIANLELQRGVNDWLSAEGNQYAELDTDWDGPGGSLSGEPASVSIYQNIDTVPGASYTLSFDFSPRPDYGQDENWVKVFVDGTELANISANGSGLENTNWNHFSYNFIAQNTLTTITFTDYGIPNSSGTFLDNVSLMCNPYEELPDTTFHFIKVECPAWTDITGNGNADNQDATGGEYVNFTNYSSSGPHFPATYASKPVTQSEIPLSCQKADGWQFKFSIDSEHTQWTSFIGPTDENGEASISFSQLVSAQQDQLTNGDSLWVSEDLSTKPNDAEFAAIRCYTDALNGDNLEWVSLGSDSSTWPSDVYCIAYNVLEEPQEETGSITIYKYNDLNGDGGWGDGENPLSDWEVIIYSHLIQVDNPVLTDNDGKVVFSSLQAGNYRACEIMQDEWENTQPGYEPVDIGDGIMEICEDVVLEEGEDLSVYFGNREIATTGSITVCKYRDYDPYGGEKGEEDMPLSWNINVHGNGELDYDEDVTTNSETGCYEIFDLEFGSYTVTEELLPGSGWSQMYPSGGSGNESQTFDLSIDNPSEDVYFLNYYETSQLPIMYACNASTLQCAIGDGPFASLQGCQDACGASAGPGGGQYVAPLGIVAGAATERGEVAGDSTCSPYLLKYIKLGASNDPEEVKKLQSFLNDYLGLNLEVSGIYDQVTYEAVKQFQLLMKDDILGPWVAVGCLPSENIATGYVYRTTTWAINNIFCPAIKPDVSNEQCFAGTFIGLGDGEGIVAGAATSTFDETTGGFDETTTTTIFDETIGDTTTTLPGENGNVKPQNWTWIWILIGFLVIGGVVYSVYGKKKA